MTGRQIVLFFPAERSPPLHFPVCIPSPLVRSDCDRGRLIFPVASARFEFFPLFPLRFGGWESLGLTLSSLGIPSSESSCVFVKSQLQFFCFPLHSCLPPLSSTMLRTPGFPLSLLPRVFGAVELQTLFTLFSSRLPGCLRSPIYFPLDFTSRASPSNKGFSGPSQPGSPFSSLSSHRRTSSFRPIRLLHLRVILELPLISAAPFVSLVSLSYDREMF